MFLCLIFLSPILCSTITYDSLGDKNRPFVYLPQKGCLETLSIRRSMFPIPWGDSLDDSDEEEARLEEIRKLIKNSRKKNSSFTYNISELKPTRELKKGRQTKKEVRSKQCKRTFIQLAQKPLKIMTPRVRSLVNPSVLSTHLSQRSILTGFKYLPVLATQPVKDSSTFEIEKKSESKSKPKRTFTTLDVKAINPKVNLSTPAIKTTIYQKKLSDDLVWKATNKKTKLDNQKFNAKHEVKYTSINSKLCYEKYTPKGFTWVSLKRSEKKEMLWSKSRVSKIARLEFLWEIQEIQLFNFSIGLDLMQRPWLSINTSNGCFLHCKHEKKSICMSSLNFFFKGQHVLIKDFTRKDHQSWNLLNKGFSDSNDLIKAIQEKQRLIPANLPDDLWLFGVHLMDIKSPQNISITPKLRAVNEVNTTFVDLYTRDDMLAMLSNASLPSNFKHHGFLIFDFVPDGVYSIFTASALGMSKHQDLPEYFFDSSIQEAFAFHPFDVENLLSKKLEVSSNGSMALLTGHGQLFVISKCKKSLRAITDLNDYGESIIATCLLPAIPEDWVLLFTLDNRKVRVYLTLLSNIESGDLMWLNGSEGFALPTDIVNVKAVKKSSSNTSDDVYFVAVQSRTNKIKIFNLVIKK